MEQKLNNEKFSAVLKQKLVEMLQSITIILDKHHIDWWVAFGSAIGAVRHGGFIPWDDDIDIHIRYADLDKVYSLKNEFEKEGRTIYSIDKDGYYLTYPNFVLMNSSVWEVKTYPFVTGLSIDIFPLFETSDDLEGYNAQKIEYTKKLNKLRLSCERYSFSFIVKLIRGGHVKRLHSILSNFFYYRKKRNILVHEFHEYENQISSSGTHYFFPYSYAKNVNNYYDKNWFEGYSFTDFEGIKVRLPKDYHSYLKQIYGEYMKLPPIEKQVAHHRQVYVNLKEKLTLSEIKERLKKGETFVC